MSVRSSVLVVFSTFLAFVATAAAAAPATPANPAPGSTSSPGPVQSSTNVTLSWNSSTGTSSYSVAVRNMSTSALVVDTTTSSTSYTAALSSGTPHRWNVAACNSSGCSSYTTVLHFQTPTAATLPGAPRNLATAAGNARISLAWDPPSSNGGASITSYRVFRGTSSSNTLIVTSGGCANLGAVLSCNDTGLTNGQSYYYIVSAVNSAGQGAPSSGATATPTVPVSIPSTPLGASPGSTNAPGPTQGSTSVTMSWSPSSGATTYSLGVRNMNTNTLVIDTNTSGTSYTASSLSSGTPYRWNVAACSSAGCSGFTTALYFQTPSSATIPGAPRNLAAAPGNGQVSLAWDPPSSNGGASITNYRVFRGTSSSNTSIVTSGSCANLGAVLSCNDTGLTNGQSYYYIVSAVNSAGQGAPSNGATVTPAAPVTIPSAPLGAAPGSANAPGPIQGSTSVTMSWNPSGGATTYSLGVRDMNTNALVVDATVTNTSYTASLSSGTPYRWNVAACSSAGCSGFTTVLYFQTPSSATIPGAPRNLAAAPGNGQVSLAWDPPSSNGGASITNYRVFRGTSSSNTSIVTSGSCANLGAVLSCNDTGLTNGQSYYYIVSAVNSAGQGAPSNGATVTPTAPVTIPSSPLGAAPGSANAPGPTQGSTSVTMSWNPSGGATTYSLGVRDTNTNALVVDVTVASTSYTASLSSGTPYRWNVAACSSAGCSGFTTVLYFQTPSSSATIPGAPRNLAAAPGNGQVSLAWDPPSSNGGASITNYRVFRGTSSSNTSIVTSGSCANLGAVLSCNDTGLTNGQSYYYIVSAVNSAGQGAPSNGATVTPAASVTIPSAPLGAAPGSANAPGPTQGSTSVTMSWNPSGGATTYSLGVRDMNTNALVVDATVTNTSYTASLSSGTPYRWNVAACSSAGCSGFTTVLYFQTPSSSATIPGAPRNLAAAPGNGQVSLAWDPPSSNGGASITNYRVFRGTSSSNTSIVTSGSCANLGAVLSCNDTGLTNGQSYYYIVSAVNSAGQGAPSNGATVTPTAPVTIPSAPLGAAPGSANAPGPTQGSTSVTMSWNPSGGATTYSLGVRDMNTNALVVDATVTNTSYTASLSSGTPYRWNVAACSSAGCSGFTTVLYFQTPSSATIPGAPRNLAAAPGNGQVSLAWDPPSSNGGASITNYRVFRGTSSSNTSIVTSGSCANLGAVLSCNDTGLTNGQSYYYIVSAVNSAGQGAPSNGATVTPTAPVTIPSAPLGAAPGSANAPGPTQGSTSVTMSWNPSGGATTYSLGVRDMNTNALVVDATVTNTSYTASLSSGTPYRWNVAACSSAGCSGFTTALYFQTPSSSATIPGAPRNLAAAPGNGQVSLAWDPPSSNGGASITSYRVFRGTSSSNTSIVTSGSCANLGAVLSCNDTGLTNGQSYYYIVSAVNSAGQGAPSNGATVTPAASSCVLTCTAALPTTSQAGVPVTFSASSSTSSCGDAASVYSWAFGDGSASSAASGAKTYTGAGTYNWTMTATAGGQTCSRSGTITVAAKPGAFTLTGSARCGANPTRASVLLNWGAAAGATTYTVYRNGIALPAATNLPPTQLQFEDATVSASASYSYVVRAGNNAGSIESNALSINVPVDVCSATPSVRLADVSVNPPSARAGSLFTYEATVTGTGASAASVTATLTGPATQTLTLDLVPGTSPATFRKSLTIATAGAYSTSFRASAGGVAQSDAALAGPTVTSTVTGVAPTASFSFLPALPKVGDEIQFVDQSTGSPGSWRWDFDSDGLTDATTRNPVHTFATAGSHRVTLQVSNPYGSSLPSTTEMLVQTTKSVPVLTSLRRDLEGTFLGDSQFDTTLFATVDWRGAPGTVQFAVEGGPLWIEPATSTGAFRVFRIGRDLAASVKPWRLVITPISSGGLRGAETIASIAVSPYPPWLVRSIAKRTGTVLLSKLDREIDYRIKFRFPQDPIPPPLRLPSFIPVYGDTDFGLTDLHAAFDGHISSGGAGKFAGGGALGFTAAGYAAALTARGNGSLRLTHAAGLELTDATLGGSGLASFEKEWGVLDVIGCKAKICKSIEIFNEIPLVGKTVNAITGTSLTVGGSLRADLQTRFSQGADGDLHFAASTGRAELNATATFLWPLVTGFANLRVSVGVGADAVIGVPAPYLRSYRVSGNGEIQVTVRTPVNKVYTVAGAFRCDWQKDRQLQCKDPQGKASFTEASIAPAAIGSMELTSGARKPPVQRSLSHTGSSATATASNDSTLNVRTTSSAAPVLVSCDGGRVLLWSDASSGTTVVLWSRWNGSTWTAPRPLGASTGNSLAPAAAGTAGGQVVAAWLHTTQVPPAQDDAAGFSAYLKSFDVMTSTYDPAADSWSSPRKLTTDDRFDFDPRLVSGGGRILLTWQSNGAGVFIGTSDSPSDLRYSTYENGVWGAPGTIATGLADVHRHVSAIGSRQMIAVVSREGNDEESSTLSAYVGDADGWSLSAGFGSAGVDNRSPVAAYDHNGVAHVVWVAGSDLVEATLNDPRPKLLRARSGSMSFYATALMTSPSGRLSLVRHEIGADAMASVVAMTYDPSRDAWSSDLRLTRDAAVAHDFFGYFDANEVLHGAYLATSMTYATQIMEVDGSPAEVANVPTQGATEMRLLDHVLATDLAVENADLVISTGEPSEGADVTAVLHVHNSGDFAVPSATVDFYDGDPDGGGALLGSALTGVLRGGDAVSVPLSFVSPRDLSQIVAVVDRANLISEISKGNNRAMVSFGNVPPVAGVLASATAGKMPLTVSFDGSQSFDPDGDAVMLTWLFADGTASVTGARVTHRFETAGTYPVTVIASDSRGGRATATVVISVASSKTRAVSH